MITPKIAVPLQLPARPLGWLMESAQHLNFRVDGCIFTYTVRDDQGRKMPFSYQYHSSAKRNGFALPGHDTLLSWDALRAEWPAWLELHYFEIDRLLPPMGPLVATAVALPTIDIDELSRKHAAAEAAADRLNEIEHATHPDEWRQCDLAIDDYMQSLASAWPELRDIARMFLCIAHNSADQTQTG